MSSFKIQKLFDGKVVIMKAGIVFGDCAPATKQWDNLNCAREIIGAEVILAPTLAFTNTVSNVKSGDYNLVDSHIMRSKDESDGVIITSSFFAGAIPNADCPQSILYDPINHEMAMLHCGQMCLVRPDGSMSIIEAAVERFKVEPQKLMLWAGFGIGPCCFGKNDSYYHSQFEGFIKERFPESTTRKVEKGPLRGQVAYDLYSMIAIIAKKVGIKSVQIDLTCTACEGRDEAQFEKYGTYFSNEYCLNDPQRNCFLARLT